MALLRRNAVYITLPIAGVVGFIGYNLESWLSDKYTPYSREFSAAPQTNYPKITGFLVFPLCSLHSGSARQALDRGILELECRQCGEIKAQQSCARTQSLTLTAAEALTLSYNLQMCDTRS